MELANAPNHFLSTVQVGITLAGILAGALGGATIVEEMVSLFSYVAWLAPYSEALGLAIVVLSITYLSLVLGELVPKRLALNNPERVAAAVAIPMRTLSVIASPVIEVLTVSTEAALRLMRVRPSTGPPITEEEIKILIEQGTQAGVFEAAEQELVARVFRLGDRRVAALMTPRTEIVWLDLDDSSETHYHTITHSTHTLFPVGQGSLDNLLGVAQAREILTRRLTGQSVDLQTLWQRPLLVPENLPVLKALALFKQSDQRMVLVMDEYGGIQGLITHTDILESLVGDMPMAAVKPAEAQAVQREDGTWLLDGMMLVDEFKDLFHLDQLRDEDLAGYQTVGGLVMNQIGRIPVVGEHFEWYGLRFEVMDMDRHRVDKVLVMPSERIPDAGV